MYHLYIVLNKICIIWVCKMTPNLYKSVIYSKSSSGGRIEQDRDDKCNIYYPFLKNWR